MTSKGSGLSTSVHPRRAASAEHRWTFAARPDQLAVARRFVSELLADWSEQRRYDAVLVANELLANAIRHGDGEVELAVARDRDGVHIRVHDSGHGDEPVVAGPSTAAESGRGLHLIETLAETWGWRRQESGTLVWCQLDRQHRDG